MPSELVPDLSSVIHYALLKTESSDVFVIPDVSHNRFYCASRPTLEPSNTNICSCYSKHFLLAINWAIFCLYHLTAWGEWWGGFLEFYDAIDEVHPQEYDQPISSRLHDYIVMKADMVSEWQKGTKILDPSLQFRVSGPVLEPLFWEQSRKKTLRHKRGVLSRVSVTYCLTSFFSSGIMIQTNGFLL